MTAYTKVAGAWRTVSQPYFKLSGLWKTCASMSVRAGWPNRYPTQMLPPNILTAPALWKVQTYAGYDETQPAAVAEGGRIRLTWTIDAGMTSFQGYGVTFWIGNVHTVSITCSDAPAGVPWRAKVVNGSSGNWVTGPGTSTLTQTETIGSYTRGTGIETGEAATGTAGHLVSAFTITVAGTPAAGANDFVPTPWKQAWPTPGVGAPTIVGVRKEAAEVGDYGYTYTESLRYRNDRTHFLDSKFTLPQVPYYRVGGDPSTIASAKVTLRFTPAAPKSPVEHTISWEAPVGWALYHIGYMGDDGYTHFYYAAMTDAEAATERAKADRFVTKMWSPREGGWFVWMPVCWDASGVTVPMRSEVSGTADSGNDIYSGYGNFPPNRSATSALADYTVANGYSDMASTNIAYTAITIELKNSGGTVIASWTGSLATGAFKDSPGKGSAPVALAATRGDPDMTQVEFYWPVEWRGLFDNLDTFGQAYKVVWGRDVPNKGEGEWDVLDRDGVKIGDFRLAMRYGYPGIIEIRGVNLAPDLVGLGIMKTVVAHGVEWCPTEDVIILPPDEPTKTVMQTWGWHEMTELSPLSMAALPQEYRDNIGACLYMWSDPMYNRFIELGFPSWQEVTQ